VPGRGRGRSRLRHWGATSTVARRARRTACRSSRRRTLGSGGGPRPSGIDIYFCDPKSPWQRGTNENTNGLLRQYFPKGTDLATITELDLDRVADELNDGPRKRLGLYNPNERLAELLLH
jgi:hypothetical protein